MRCLYDKDALCQDFSAAPGDCSHCRLMHSLNALMSQLDAMMSQLADAGKIAYDSALVSGCYNSGLSPDL